MTRGGKRALVALALLFVIAGGAVVALPPLLFGDGVDYSQVTPITAAVEYHDAALLERAWKLPAAAVYKDDMEYQKNGSFCGPTSATVVGRSLGVSVTQNDVLTGGPVHTTFGMVLGGLTLEQLAEVITARLHKRVEILRDLDLQQFRAELLHANDLDRRYIVNFHRGPLFARGGGHHSPIGGYLADVDLVFVLDVNEKYKPWLVKSERLWNAVNTVDPQSRRKRGLLRIQ